MQLTRLIQILQGVQKEHKNNLEVVVDVRGYQREIASLAVHTTFDGPDLARTDKVVISVYIDEGLGPRGY